MVGDDEAVRLPSRVGEDLVPGGDGGDDERLRVAARKKCLLAGSWTSGMVKNVASWRVTAVGSGWLTGIV